MTPFGLIILEKLPPLVFSKMMFYGAEFRDTICHIEMF